MIQMRSNMYRINPVLSSFVSEQALPFFLQLPKATAMSAIYQ